MTSSSNETDRSRKGYAIVGIVLAPIVLLACVNGIMAFVRVFTHTLGAIFLTLEIAFVGLVVGAIGFWLLQRDRSAGYTRMQATLDQLLNQESRSFSLVDFAAKVQLPISIVRGFLDTAIQERDGSSHIHDGGEIIYSFMPDTATIEPIKTVDVEAISTEKIDSAANALFTSVGYKNSQSVDKKSDRDETQNSKIENSRVSVAADEPSSQSKEVDRSLTEQLKHPLIQAQLARRLSLSSSTLSYRKLKPDFPQWVQEKDPEGIAWQYSPDTKKFYPQ